MYLEDVFPGSGGATPNGALAGSGLRCPPTDAALLDRYLEYFFTSGYLTRPEPAPVHGKSYATSHTATPGSEHTA
ncbi:Amino acid adenylation domain-containing protein OS=Streptomyces rimosus subsp. rimosus (strain ATCC / DSM 40260 / JCM 4667 / NRRL 2234) OX=1265868 GN=SRIM_040095 PE=4 SV=1 [Streptomyces rimosus subsp. rimosus]